MKNDSTFCCCRCGWRRQFVCLVVVFCFFNENNIKMMTTSITTKNSTTENAVKNITRIACFVFCLCFSCCCCFLFVNCDSVNYNITCESYSKSRIYLSFSQEMIKWTHGRDQLKGKTVHANSVNVKIRHSHSQYESRFLFFFIRKKKSAVRLFLYTVLYWIVRLLVFFICILYIDHINEFDVFLVFGVFLFICLFVFK